MTNPMITIATAAKETASATSAVTLPEAPAGGTFVAFTAWMQNVNGDAKRTRQLYEEGRKKTVGDLTYQVVILEAVLQ